MSLVPISEGVYPIQERQLTASAVGQTLSNPLIKIVMQYLQVQVPLTEVLLTPQLIERLRKCDDKEVLSVAKLIVKNAQAALKAYRNGTLLHFDGLCGDFGCERIALMNFILYRSIDLQTEVSDASDNGLTKRLQTCSQALNRVGSRQNCHRNSHRDPQDAAFKAFEELSVVTVSPEMACLMQTHIITTTKKTYVKKEGIESWKTDISLLDKLAPGYGYVRKAMVGEVQAQVSNASMALMRAEAAQLRRLPASPHSVLRQMLETGTVSKEYVHKNDIPILGKRIFGCSFYTVKAIMEYMLENGVLVGFKKMVNQNQKTYVIPYIAETGTFRALLDGEVVKVQRNAPIIILEAQVSDRLSQSDVVKRIADIGLYDLVLANCSQEPPYGEGSSIHDVTIAAAREEIEHYRKRSVEIACVKGQDPDIMMDHIYCNTVGNEVSS